MSIATSIATAEKTAIMGYICSGCHRPVLSVLRVRAVVRKQRTTGFRRVQKEDIASGIARKLALETVKKIERMQKNKRAADIELATSDMVSYGCFSDVSVEEYGSPCPSCGGCEPWMPARLSKKKLHELGDESFPVIFDSYEEAEVWAAGEAQRCIARIKEVRQSAEAVAQASEEAERLGDVMAELEAQRASLPELAVKEQLEKERAELETQKDGLGLLDIQAKKTLKEKVKTLVWRLERNQEKLEQAQKEIDQQLRETAVALENAQAIAWGCTGEVLKRKKENSISFYPRTKVSGEGAEQETERLTAGWETYVERVNDWGLFPYRVDYDSWTATEAARLQASGRALIRNIVLYGSVAIGIYFVYACVSFCAGGSGKDLLRACCLAVVFALADYAYLRRRFGKGKDNKERQ